MCFFCSETEISIDQTLDDSGEEKFQPKTNPLYAILAKQCVLTPFTHLDTNTHIQTLTEYIDQRGTMPSMVDRALIRRDITKALSYLKSKGVVDLEPAEEKIAVQLVKYILLRTKKDRACPSLCWARIMILLWVYEL